MIQKKIKRRKESDLRRLIFIIWILPLSLFAQEVEKDTFKTDEMFVLGGPETGFPGGEDSLMQFLTKNLNFSKEEHQTDIKAIVIVCFVVGEKGKVQDIEICGGDNNTESMNQEVIRVIKLMPDWIPVYADGKPQKFNIRLPINIKLE